MGAADGWVRAVSGGGKSVARGRARERWVAWVMSGGGRTGEGLGRIRPSRGGISLFFFFYLYFFSISFSLIPFPFKQKFIKNFLGVQNEIFYVKCY